MIFVTVGTHEQQFNRLIRKIDELKRDGIITEDVFMQTGYCTYQPQFCKWESLISYKDMLTKVKEARIVITHGGPATFLMPLQEKKIPIVVPRKLQYDEHVNDHQVEFAKFIEERQGNIIVVEDINDLENTIINYNTNKEESLVSNNELFNSKIQTILEKY